MCLIGQDKKCKVTGCEWSKTFGEHCYYPNFKNKTTEPTKIAVSKKKKGRFVKDKPKYTEIKAVASKIKKSNEIDFTKIQTQQQDDWIKKIKIIDSKTKF